MRSYRITPEELLAKLNKNRSRRLSKRNIFARRMKVSLIEEIDELFNKGIFFYIDPDPFSEKAASSYFFRRRKFNGELKFGDCWRLHQLDHEMALIRGTMILSGQKIKPELERLAPTVNAKKAAQNIRRRLRLDEAAKCKSDRGFLRFFISQLAEEKIMVLEFLEQRDPFKKTTIEGLFLSPNNICIKRQQHNLKREIFVLAHELGHYLLDKEEIDQNPPAPANKKLREIENWCDTFAFYLLAGEAAAKLPALFSRKPSVDNPRIQALSNSLRIGKEEIYDHLLQNKKIGKAAHANLRQALAADRKTDEDGAKVKLIYSPLLEAIYRNAYLEGSIEEMEVIKRFNPTLKQVRNGFFDRLIYGMA
jgi:Zn-dependent peptidase ImmA (M78 family)